MSELSESSARLEFAHYFLALEKEMKADGSHVSKSAEWERFIVCAIEDGRAPAEAYLKWRCPRSINGEIRKANKQGKPPG